MQLLKNRTYGGGPFERLAVGVVASDKLIDAPHELFDAGERATPNRLVGDQREEALSLVQPRSVNRDEVHVAARPSGQPGLDLRMAVCSVVVADSVNLQLITYGLMDRAQESRELLVSVAGLAGGQHGAVKNAQGSEQPSRVVSLVVMGDALDTIKTHGQHGLGALQRSALTLVAHTDHQGVVRWTQVQADYIAQFLNEERVVGELEALRAMRLQAKQLETPCDAGLGNTGLGGRCTHTLVRGTVGRLGVPRGLDQMRHAFVIDLAWFAGAHVVLQASDASPDKPRAQLNHSGFGKLQAIGDGIVEFAIGTARDMRARALNAAGRDRLRANDSSCQCSSPVSSNRTLGLPVRMAVFPFPKYRAGRHDESQKLTGKNTSL